MKYNVAIGIVLASYTLFVCGAAKATYPIFRLSLIGILLDPVAWVAGGITVWLFLARPSADDEAGSG